MEENKLTNERYIYLDLSNPIFCSTKIDKAYKDNFLFGYEILMGHECGGKSFSSLYKAFLSTSPNGSAVNLT